MGKIIALNGGQENKIPDNNGESDIYVSSRNNEGSWTTLKNMGFKKAENPEICFDEVSNFGFKERPEDK